MSNPRPRGVAVTVVTVTALVGACGSDGATTQPSPAPPATTSPTTGTTAPPADPESAPPTIIDLPDAVSVNVAVDPAGGLPVVAWTERDAVRLARADLTSATLSDVVDVADDAPPTAHPIERPALAFDAGGVVHVA